MRQEILLTVNDFSAHSGIPTIDLCLLLMQCCQRAQRSQASNIAFLPCPLNMISLDSQNLLIICTVDKHYSEVLQQFLDSYLKIDEPLPFFTSEKVCLFKIHFLYCIVNKIQIYEI